jgi:RNA 2',3'-cyclic 3'-phosphodiesterase
VTQQLKHHMVFLALWPDEKTRINIVNSFKLSEFINRDGKDLRAQKLHLTLHFLGNISPEKYQCVVRMVQEIQFKAFDIVLNRFGVFPKAGVFYLGMSNIPHELVSLHKKLGEKLQQCDYRPESRRFAPHVTLKRKISQFDIQTKPQPVRWQVGRFALVESIPVANGVLYKPVKFY